MNQTVTTMIPLNKLRKDKVNVRTSKATKEADEELIASIASVGLLENLCVAPRDRDLYGVIAGGRRFQALCALHKRGDLPNDHPVPCLIIDDDAATEVSLAENTARLAMHPADQVVAFARLEKQGATPEQIGNRFGLPPRDVRARLRLGSLPPAILDDWRSDELDSDAVHAFASTEDTELQERLYEQLKQGTRGNIEAYQVQRALSERSASPSSPVFKYVGMKAYQKAGGRTEETLFDRDEVRLLDPSIIQKLALEKLERAAERAAKGWKWYRAVLDFDYQERQGYAEVEVTPDDFTEEEVSRYNELTREIEAIGDDEELEYWAAWEKQRPLEREQAKIEVAAKKRGKVTDEQKALAGVVATIDHNGKGKLWRMVSPSDKAAYNRLMKGSGPDDAKPKKKAAAGEYAKAVVEDLRVMRGAAVARALAGNPRLARDVAAFTLARKGRMSEHRRYESGHLLRVRMEDIEPSNKGSLKLKGDPIGDEVLAPFGGKLDWSFLELANVAESFSEFMKLTAQARDKILAHAVADTLIPRLANDASDGSYGFAFEQLCEFLGMDFPARAREVGVLPLPVEAFWSRLSKAHILSAAKVLGEDWVEQHRKLKKGDLVTAVAEAFEADAPDWLPGGFLLEDS